jgi:hypothetical protein
VVLENSINAALTIHPLRDHAMYACPKCARTWNETQFAERDAECPACGAELNSGEGERWIDVARVANLAEAGFLSDELLGLEIDARIHQLQEFNAVTDHWKATYLIRVPESAARDAADRIREYLADDAAQSESEGGGLCSVGSGSLSDPLLWKPLAVVLLASVSSFVLGQRFSELHHAKAEHRAQSKSLTSAVEEIDRPFVAEAAGGEPAHRLQFDRRRQSWLLDTDRDGDGRYDSRQAFQASGASW